VYRFKVQERRIDEWLAVAGLSEEDGWNWEGEEVAAGTIIRGRTFETGQMILIGRRLTTVDNGRLQVRTLANTAEFERTLRHILNQGAER
jgi:amide synthase